VRVCAPPGRGVAVRVAVPLTGVDVAVWASVAVGVLVEMKVAVGVAVELGAILGVAVKVAVAGASEVGVGAGVAGSGIS
jgi:hypothetical protein